MIHGLCYKQNKKNLCMQNGKYMKYFPKKVVNVITIDSCGYPIYKWRDNGKFVKRDESFANNKFVVSYNKTLILKYNTHINVEWCNQHRSIKYLFKYVNTGHGRVTINFYSNSNKKNHDECVDEIKIYYDCRYLSSCKVVWKIFCFDINLYREFFVERLPFYLDK